MREEDTRGLDSPGVDTGQARRDDGSSSAPRVVVRRGAGSENGVIAAADTAISSPALSMAAQARSAAAAPTHASPLDDPTLRKEGTPERPDDETVPGVDVDAPTEIGGAGSEPGARGTAMSASGEQEGENSLVGQMLLERYQVSRKLGQGGMGVVYEATHTLIGKRVAIKILLDKYAGREQIVARLVQEARLASSIGHEHIIDIADVGKTGDGRTFVVMEFLEGQSLGQLLRDGPLPEERIVHIAHQVASALHAAHQKGIVHRDIKPENVFLLERGGGDFVKVVDFGISKSVRTGDEDGEEATRLTQTGMVLGTPLYMSPEQARGDDNLDCRIDVYALGVIMYEMATGEVPFRGSNYLSIISQVLEQEPKPPRQLRPDLSHELEEIILRALDKEPDDRYQSCEELAGDLALLLEVYGVTTSRRRIVISRPRRRRRRRRSGLKVLAWIAGIAATMCAMAVTIYVLMSSSQKTIVVQPPAIIPPVVPDTRPVEANKVVDAGPAVPMARVTIHSVPDGAVVLAGGRIIGTTPFEYDFPRENKIVELIARLPGFPDTSFFINPFNDSKVPVTVALEKPRREIRGSRRQPTEQGTNQTPRGKQGSGTGTAGGELGGNPYKRPDGNP